MAFRSPSPTRCAARMTMRGEELTVDELERLRAVSDQLDAEDDIQFRRLVGEHMRVRAVRDQLQLHLHRCSEERMQLWRRIEELARQT